MQRSVNIRSRIHLQGTFWHIFLFKAKLFDIFQATSLLIAFTLEFLFYHLKWKSSSTWFRSRAFQFCAKKIFVFFYKKLVLKLSFMIVKKEGNTVPKTGPKSLILPFYNVTTIYSFSKKSTSQILFLPWKFFWILLNCYFFQSIFIYQKQFCCFCFIHLNSLTDFLKCFLIFGQNSCKEFKRIFKAKKESKKRRWKPKFLTTRWDFSKDNFKL